jgi:hypothetical protein
MSGGNRNKVSFLALTAYSDDENESSSSSEGNVEKEETPKTLSSYKNDTRCPTEARKRKR